MSSFGGRGSLCRRSVAGFGEEGWWWFLGLSLLKDLSYPTASPARRPAKLPPLLPPQLGPCLPSQRP